MDELAAAQLAALDRVHDLFQREQLAYWLFGGWAVDFYVGSPTRPHDDIDIAVWLNDVPRIADVLAADGWRHAPSSDDDGGTGYERAGVRLELTYLVRDSHGTVYIPLRDGPATWSNRGDTNDVRELNGVRARLIGLSALTRGKSSPRDDPEDAAKDRADFRALSRL
jgi:hypothetical protein